MARKLKLGGKSRVDWIERPRYEAPFKHVLSLKKASRMKLGDAVKLAVDRTRKTGMEVGFAYDTVTRKPITPIIISKIPDSINPDLYGNMMRKFSKTKRLGFFHTHPADEETLKQSMKIAREDVRKFMRGPHALKEAREKYLGFRETMKRIYEDFARDAIPGFSPEDLLASVEQEVMMAQPITGKKKYYLMQSHGLREFDKFSKEINRLMEASGYNAVMPKQQKYLNYLLRKLGVKRRIISSNKAAPTHRLIK